MTCDRREFLTGAAACGGLGLLSPAAAFAADSPLLRLGVVSDMHLGPGGSHAAMGKALVWLDEMKVDAVAFTGDMINIGIMDEAKMFMAQWNGVFQGNRAKDGRSVERLVVSGNHDAFDHDPKKFNLPGWTEQKLLDETIRRDLKNRWKEAFGEDWQLIWRKEVKGVTFVGTQYLHFFHPPVERYFRENAAAFAKDRPFFVLQHAHPKGTCYGKIARSAEDRGEMARALAAFPNAVVLSGHSHIPLADERSVWQGAFTSIGCGCAGVNSTTASAGDGYANEGEGYGPHFKRFNPQPSPNEGSRGVQVIDVSADRLVLHRHSTTYDCPIGPDWAVPIPARAGGPYDYDRRAKTGKAPEFPAGTVVDVERLVKDVACVRISFPAAKPGRGRVYGYSVDVFCDGRKVLSKKFLSPDFHLPESKAGLSAAYLIKAEELPKAGTLRFAVSPHDAYGASGRAVEGKVVLAE